jgi:hypothetical protein
MAVANEQRIEFTGFFGQMFSSWYPKNCVIGVIDDEEEARQAITDFRAAGFEADDVRLFPGAEVMQIDAQIRKQWNPVQRVMATISSGTDEGAATQTYLDEARKGHTIVAVRVGHRTTPDPRVAPIMQAHHAHTIHMYGDFAITEVRP